MDFVGRVDGLDLVRVALDEARSGQSSVLWVEAAAGAGKTAFVRRAVESAPPSTVVHRVSAEEIAADVGFALVDQFGVAHEEHPFAVGLQLLDLFAGADAPTLVVLEDLHWADATSRLALLTAVRRLDQDGVVVLVTSRPPNPAAAPDDGWARFVAESPRVVRIELRPLTAPEIAELAGRSGQPISPRRAAELYEHTLGNALYVRTLLDELTPDDLVDTGVPLPVPLTLAATTMARLRRSSDAARNLAAALAVLNRSTPLAVAAWVADLDAPTEALDELLASGLVTWSPAVPGTPVEFAHPLYRRAVYDTLPPSLRQRQHRRAAAVVRPNEALAHRAAAADGFDEELADDLVTAAEAEQRAGQLSTAAAHLLSAAAVTGRRDLAADRLLRGAKLLLDDGQTGRVVALLDGIVSCQPSGRRSLVLGTLAWQRGDAVGAERWLGEAAVDRDRAIAAAGLALLGLAFGFLNRHAEAMRAGEAVVAMDGVDPAIVSEGWRAIGIAEGMSNGPRRALDRLGERLPSDPAEVGADDIRLLTWRALIGTYGGLIDEPLADLRRAIAIAPHAVGARGHLHLAQALVRSGAWDEALTQARVARSLAADAREVWMVAQIEATLAQLLAARGDQVAADEHLAAARHVLASVSTFESAAMVSIATGQIGFIRYEPAVVVEHLAPMSDAEATGTNNRLMSIDWWWQLLIARLNLGDGDGAALELDRFRDAVDRRGIAMPGRIADMKARLAWARQDPDAVEVFAAALSSPDANMPALQRALLHQGYGEVLHLTGQRRPAMDQLRIAHDLLQALGAEPFRSRVDMVLTQRGDKAVRSRVERRFTLTDRELDVATLVATGMTNKEVAANLYVSAKAVEFHLGNIYAKLGLTSRRELRQRQGELLREPRHMP